ncbi:MAG: hypothetical protein WC583_05920 [Candidatus Omnitrophota bacterium]|jgi:hypothetical protein|nr:hypothetical protein [Candidatus Omnitrophota bacterium]
MTEREGGRLRTTGIKGIKLFLSAGLPLAVVCFSVAVGAAAPAGKRDPFIPLVTPEGRLIQSAAAPGEGEVRLEGLIYDDNGPSLAVLNGAVAGVGDSVRGYRVIKITENKVTLMKDGELKELPLQKKKEESFENAEKR